MGCAATHLVTALFRRAGLGPFEIELELIARVGPHGSVRAGALDDRREEPVAVEDREAGFAEIYDLIRGGRAVFI